MIDNFLPIPDAEPLPLYRKVLELACAAEYSRPRAARAAADPLKWLLFWFSSAGEFIGTLSALELPAPGVLGLYGPDHLDGAEPASGQCSRCLWLLVV